MWITSVILLSLLLCGSLTIGVSLAKVCRSLMLLLTRRRMFFTWELRFWLEAYEHNTPILQPGDTIMSIRVQLGPSVTKRDPADFLATKPVTGSPQRGRGHAITSRGRCFLPKPFQLTAPAEQCYNHFTHVYCYFRNLGDKCFSFNVVKPDPHNMHVLGMEGLELLSCCMSAKISQDWEAFLVKYSSCRWYALFLPS